MQSPNIIPASCPDTVKDAADGATFYLDPHQHPKFAGQAFIATDDESAAKDARLCVRLVDGRACHFPKDWGCRVSMLVAETSGDQW